VRGSSWSWSYGSWSYNYLCSQCLSPLPLWVWNLLRRGVLDTTLCDKICEWHATGQWFSPCTPVSSTNKSYCYDITEILLKVVLNTITITPITITPIQAQMILLFVLEEVHGCNQYHNFLHNISTYKEWIANIDFW
jgi:hypothetical protein